MIDLMHFLGGKTWKVLADLREQLVSREDLIVLRSAGWIEKEGRPVGCVVEAVSDLIDIVRLDSSGLQAVVDRANGEVTGMFLATEAFFCCAGYDFAIDE